MAAAAAEVRAFATTDAKRPNTHRLVDTLEGERVVNLQVQPAPPGRSSLPRRDTQRFYRALASCGPLLPAVSERLYDPTRFVPFFDVNCPAGPAASRLRCPRFWAEDFASEALGAARRAFPHVLAAPAKWGVYAPGRPCLAVCVRGSLGQGSPRVRVQARFCVDLDRPDCPGAFVVDTHLMLAMRLLLVRGLRARHGDLLEDWDAAVRRDCYDVGRCRPMLDTPVADNNQTTAWTVLRWVGPSGTAVDEPSGGDPGRARLAARWARTAIVPCCDELPPASCPRGFASHAWGPGDVVDPNEVALTLRRTDRSGYGMPLSAEREFMRRVWARYLSAHAPNVTARRGGPPAAMRKPLRPPKKLFIPSSGSAADDKILSTEARAALRDLLRGLIPHANNEGARPVVPRRALRVYLPPAHGRPETRALAVYLHGPGRTLCHAASGTNSGHAAKHPGTCAVLLIGEEVYPEPDPALSRLLRPLSLGHAPGAALACAHCQSAPEPRAVLRLPARMVGVLLPEALPALGPYLEQAAAVAAAATLSKTLKRSRPPPPPSPPPQAPGPSAANALAALAAMPLVRRSKKKHNSKRKRF